MVYGEPCALKGARTVREGASQRRLPHDMYNTGETRGTSQSYNMNYQKLGHDLMSIDELAVMDGNKCIVQVRGVRPFLSDKYDLTQHPKYSLTADADKRNWFDIEKFLDHNLILKPDDQYEVIEINEE